MFSNLVSSWAIQREPSSFSPPNGLLQSNRDLDPSLARDRIWRYWMFLFYWASDSVNVGTGAGENSLLFAAPFGADTVCSMIALGLSYPSSTWELFALTANATVGARLHIPFSIIARASFGVYGAWFPIASRLVLGLIYFGINTQILSSCTAVMIGAIWPSFKHIENTIPESIGITIQGMTAYIVAWIFQADAFSAVPFLLIPPVRMRYLFLIKSVVMAIATFALLGWSVRSAGGGGPIFSQKATIFGSTRSWAWMYCINAAMSSKTTLAASISDFSRYSRSPKDQYWQIVIIARWDSRAGAFFMALAFGMGTVGTNISTNSVAVSNDFTALVPKYLNLQRGAILCAFLGGWACVPWNLQQSGTVLLNFLGGYGIFLAPAVSVMICDFWIVKKGCYVIPELYQPMGRYRYRHGVKYSYKAAWLIGFTMGFTSYYVLNLVFPATSAMSDTCILAEEAMDEINNDGVSFESGVTSTRTIYEKEDGTMG
ncbi:NCS1 nucleoside transporter family [Mucidula mucida]|nr:NCS1 nucleoside transporter family [Mucidula mucida]